MGLRTCAESEREAVGQGPEEVDEERAEEEKRAPGRKLLERRRPDFGQDGGRGGCVAGT